MAGKSQTNQPNSIANHKGQAIIELVLISVFVLFAILFVIENFESFQKDSERYLLTRQIK